MDVNEIGCEVWTEFSSSEEDQMAGFYEHCGKSLRFIQTGNFFTTGMTTIRSSGPCSAEVGVRPL
jgi:hypothetical protein